MIGLSAASILDDCADAPVESFPPGALMLDEGLWSGRLLILIEGEVEVVRGGTVVAVIGEPGALFGEMSALLDVPHTATVRARTAVSVRAPADTTAFLREHPQLAFHIARILAQRLNAATTYLVDVRRQYDGRGDHLAMVGEVLEALTLQQGTAVTALPDRPDDPRM